MVETTVRSNETDWETTTDWLARHEGLVSRSTFYKKVREGVIPVLHVGRKVLVKSNTLDRLFEHQQQEASK